MLLPVGRKKENTDSEDSESEESDDSETPVVRKDPDRSQEAAGSENTEERENTRDDEENEESSEEETARSEEEETVRSEEDEDAPEEVTLRRSTRIRRPPEKFRSGDYVTNFLGSATSAPINQQEKLVLLSRLLDLLK